MENKTIKIIIIVCVVLVISLVVFYGRTSMKETKEVCESEGGEYEFGQNRCYFKDNGVYEEYSVIEINGRKRLVRE